MQGRLSRYSPLFVLFAAIACPGWAVVLNAVRGVVHDADHRPVPGARVLIKAVSSDFQQSLSTDSDGSFESLTIPVGEYAVTVTRDGFEPSAQEIQVSSREAP